MHREFLAYHLWLAGQRDATKVQGRRPLVGCAHHRRRLELEHAAAWRLPHGLKLARGLKHSL